jgi:DNA-binding response OmpR family regulator
MGGPGEKKQLGSILLQQRLVTPEELDGLLSRHDETGDRLGAMALESGAVDEVDLLRALSEQHGLPGIDLAQTVISLQNLELVPQDIALEHHILAFSLTGEQLFLAMANPSERRLIEEIEFVTGRKVFPYVAVMRTLDAIIEEAYALRARGETYYVGPYAPETYLRELGLRPSPSVLPPRQPRRAPSSPKVAPPGPPRDAVLTSAADRPSRPPSTRGAEGSGASKFPALDPAFASRVGPLPPAPDGSPAPRRGQLVLVVEDEEDLRTMLRRVLSSRGLEVIEATRGNEALAAVREREPDLVLLDAMIPDLHGFEVCRRIKSSQKYGHIPVIMVSAIYRGWRFAEDLKQSYGVTEFIEKPFRIADVVAKVERVLAGRGEADDTEKLSEEARRCLAAGIECYRSGQLDQAIEHLEEGVRLDPLAFKLRYHLGLLLGRRERLFEGIDALETAVDLAPRHFSALKNLAVLYQRAGFKHKATELWERALGAAPDDATRQGVKDQLLSLL